MSEQWREMTAGDLGRGIGAGSIDPVALTEAFLDAIEAHPARDRIYARVTRDRARAEAHAARERGRTGMRRGVLDGVPVSWKDLFDSAGVATEAGSALLKDRIPDHDARVLARAGAAGLVCLGKTHMSELAFSGLGLNPVTATPPCINDPEAVPGGSSSGAASSVAHGLAAAGIGSDTGGSVRIPAAWNDLVGLKTTSGLLPLDGVVPLCPSFDTVGPLCRSVEDAALLLAVLGGGPATDLASADLDGRQFLVLTTAVQDDLRDAAAEGFAAALAAIERAGGHLHDIDIPAVAEALSLSAALYPTEAYGLWRERIEADPEAMYPEIRERFRGGAAVSAPDYVAARATLDACRHAWSRATAGFDAVLAPTAPNLPPNAARLLADHDYYVTENLLTLRNTRIGNLMGGSSLTLPTGVASAGLLVMAPPFDEARLLRLGAAIEKALA